MEIIKIANKTNIYASNINNYGISSDIENLSKFENYTMVNYGLKIFKEKDTYKVIVIELPANHGHSVTNAWSKLATQIYNMKLAGISVDKIRWFECYLRPIKKQDESSFDEVLLKWDGKKFTQPEWALHRY